MESLELQTAAAEARRLRADQGVASLTREQGQMVSAGRKHAALIVKWWLWGLLLGWLLAIIVSVLVSPVLGFIVVVPILAIFLTMGYASSSVEMKVDGGERRVGGIVGGRGSRHLACGFRKSVLYISYITLHFPPPLLAPSFPKGGHRQSQKRRPSSGSDGFPNARS